MRCQSPAHSVSIGEPRRHQRFFGIVASQFARLRGDLVSPELYTLVSTHREVGIGRILEVVCVLSRTRYLRMRCLSPAHSVSIGEPRRLCALSVLLTSQFARLRGDLVLPQLYTLVSTHRGVGFGRILQVVCVLSRTPVSYTHLTLPTNREV